LSCGVDSKAQLKYHNNGWIKKSYDESITIWVDTLDSVDDVRGFISWLGYSLDCDSWKKSIGDSVWYYGEYQGVKTSVSVRIPRKPLKKITILEALSGCELVERYSTHTSKTYTCATK